MLSIKVSLVAVGQAGRAEGRVEVLADAEHKAGGATLACARHRAEIQRGWRGQNGAQLK